MTKKKTCQKTLKDKVTLDGVGLHTGISVKITFKPAPVNTGFVFVRTDLKPVVEIPADVQYVTNTDRGTNLEKDGAKIQTSEHVLASLVGMGVDNCYIELDSAESPIMDGSSKFLFECKRDLSSFSGANELSCNRLYIKYNTAMLPKVNPVPK